MNVSDARRQRFREVLDRRLASLVPVAEAVHRRHNASAILRSAEGFGLHEAHLVTAGFRPSKGAARGAERWLDLRRFDTTAASVTDLRARGFAFYVADLAEGALTPEEVPVDRPVAVLFGAEMAGVSDEARALADGAVVVPMHGLTGSLNVSAAATCILYRLSERRRAWLLARTGVGGDLPAERREAFYQAWLAADLEAERGMRGRLDL